MQIHMLTIEETMADIEELSFFIWKVYRED